MAVGLHATRSDIDNKAGGLARDLANVLQNIQDFQTFLLATPDNTLTSAPYSYSAGEVAVLKSAFTDMNKLALVYAGSAAQTPAADMRAFSKQLFDFR